MPAGADAVAPLDVVVRRDGQIEIIAPVAVGEGVLPAEPMPTGQSLGAGGQAPHARFRPPSWLRPGWSICTSASRACASCAPAPRATP